MAAVPNATIIGFTGTPIARTAHGEGTFKIFGAQDDRGYLDKYSIAESIEDETTLPINPNAAVNADEQRRLRAGLYRPLLALPKDDRSRVVDLVVATLLNE